jgi:hypothetical protein
MNSPLTKSQDCYRRASECRERADASPNAKIRQTWLAQQQNWLSLARSFDDADKLDVFFRDKVDWGSVKRVIARRG